jgi:predicted adenine nucleotide alpha hydrolase (AANH) superfamily ATPase
MVDEYAPEEHLEAIRGYENNFPERCMYCYLLRLNQTAKKAKEMGFDAFSTTLLVSPYQKHEELTLIGKQLGQKYGLDFYYRDWRPFFREGQKEAKEMELYRQKYCGCIYSKQENK